MELLNKHQSPMHHDLRAWAEDHITGIPNFVLLDHDPAIYKGQSPTEHTVHGQVLPHSALPIIAEQVVPSYPAVSAAMDKYDDVLLKMGAVLNSGQNVFFGMDHHDFIDIAVGGAKASHFLRERGHVFSSAIIVNKMVSYIGVEIDGEVFPALDVIGYAYDSIFLTLPRSRSTSSRLASIPEIVIKAYNKYAIEHGITSQLDLGGTLLAGAAPGTVNKLLDKAKYTQMQNSGEQLPEIPDDDIDTYVIGHVSEGILKFTARSLSYACCMQLKDNEVRAMIGEVPFNVHDKRTLNLFMNLLGEMQHELDPAHRYVYDEDDTLPILQIGSA